MHKIDEVPEEGTLQFSKVNRSLSNIAESTPTPLFAGPATNKTSHSSSGSSTPEDESDAEDDDDDEELKTLSLAYRSLLAENDSDDEHKIKHSASEPIFAAAPAKLSLVDEDDDDEMWCNQVDEENADLCLKLDEEREKHLREVLGKETLEIVLDALKVR